MPEPYFYLRPDERILLQQRAASTYTFALLLRPTALLSILLAAFFVGRLFFEPLRLVRDWVPWAAWGVLVTIVVLVAWRRAATTEYAVTDQRIYARVGRIITSLHFTTHDKVTDIRYHQGPIERALGLGTLTFATAGGEVQVAGVRDAMGLKAVSERARDAFIRELLREAGSAAATAPATSEAIEAPEPRAPPAAMPVSTFVGEKPAYVQAGDTPVWSERPRPIAAIGSLRGLIGLLPFLFFTTALDESRRIYAVLALVGFALAFLGLRFAQFRRMEYVATDKRVYTRQGLIGTTVSQLTYDKITDITYHQDLLGRLLGYGTVRVQTAGGSQAPIAMLGLADPLAAKETIERWRDAVVGAPR